MNKQDKIIAISGVILIIILAIIAIVLLYATGGGRGSLIDGRAKTETVELVNEANMNSTSYVADIEVEPEDRSASQDITSAGSNSDVSTTLDGTTQTTKKSGTGSAPLAEKYVKSECKKILNNDTQLAELAGYWEEYHLEAVEDLIRLERIRTYTNDLAGTNKYYYYGDVDSNNAPNGRGLAVYADNTYYYGDWSRGLREGNGMWLRIYPDVAGTEGKYTGILEHQYNGEFKSDLPNGTGQEHYTMNMDEITYEVTLLNAIGGFKNGYYDGEMYMMTGNAKCNRYDWYANADEGTFEYCVPNKVSTTNKRPVWTKGEENDHSTDESDDGFYWMTDAENSGFGIYGLKK